MEDNLAGYPRVGFRVESAAEAATEALQSVRVHSSLAV